MLSLLAANHRLPLFNIADFFIWINETKQLINEFTIGYIINPGLNVNKSLRDQVENFNYTTFCEIKQPFIKATIANKNTGVLAFISFTRQYHITLINIPEC